MGRILHVNKSGLFPFCLKNQNNGATIPPNPLYYPPPVTIETAMRWYWRVKKWKLSVSHTVLIDGEETIFTDTKYLQHPNIGSAPLDRSAPIEKVEDYVCENMVQLNIISSNPDFDPGSGEDGFGASIYFAAGPPSYVDTWGIYRLPDVDENLELKDYDYYLGFNFVFGNPDFPVTSGEFNIIIRYPSTDPANQDEISLVFGPNDFVKIYPSEYWDYSGLYDKQTGMPILN